MHTEALCVAGIPALLWGRPSDRAYLYVHGKLSRKEHAEPFAVIAEEKGFQTLSFDLPEHGERAGDHARRCDIWNGVRDLAAVADHAFGRWRDLSLYACSLGAYFSLHAFAERPFVRCLFQSPIVDMEYLIERMFAWYGVTEEVLRARGEIATPIDPLRWDYYQYVRAHPVRKWDVPTYILYGGRDSFQSRAVIEGFAERFGCRLTVSEGSEHPFMAPGDARTVERWLRACI